MIPKFRAYFEQYKRMIESIGILYQNMILVDFNDCGNIENIFITDKIHVMQSTGLHDKNGVEIFEGDIVIAWSQGVKGTFEIKRRTDGLWLLYPAWKDRRFWYLRPTEDGRENCEVIGNIYANKDLLGVENDN